MLALTLETPLTPLDTEQACLVYRVCERYLEGSDIVAKAAGIFSAMAEHREGAASDLSFSVPESQCICMALSTIVRYRAEPEEVVVSARNVLEELMIPGAREVHERLFRNTVDRLSATGELPPKKDLPLRARAMVAGLTFFVGTSDNELEHLLAQVEDSTGYVPRVA